MNTIARSVPVMACVVMTIAPLRIESVGVPNFVSRISAIQQSPQIPREDKIVQLHVGRIQWRDLQGGEVHQYSVALTQGQFMKVIAQQKGIDVVVSLFGPSGQKLIEVDSPNGTQGPEPLAAIAEVAGDYRIEVRALEGKAVPGKYEIKVAELRPSTDLDRTRLEVQTTLADAEHLHAKGTKESLEMALKKFAAGLPLLQGLGDQWREASTLNVMGLIYWDLGEPQKALEYYEQALPLTRAAGDTVGEATVLQNLGINYLADGDLQKALEYYNQALPLYRKLNDKAGESIVLIQMGWISGMMNDSSKAFELYQQAFAIGHNRAKVTALNSLGELFALNDPKKALHYYNEALPLHEAIGDKVYEATTISSIGAAYWYLGDPTKALDYYHQSLRMFQASGFLMGEALSVYRIGFTYLSIGKPEEGLPFLERALSIYRKTNSKLQEARALASIAVAERNLSRLDDARVRMETSLNITESTRSNLYSPQFRTGFFEAHHSRYEFYIDLLMRIHQKQPGLGYDGAALQASERARARSLLEILAEGQINIRQGVDPMLLKRERSSQQKLNAKSEALSRLLTRKHTEKEAAAARKEAEEALNDYKDIQALIRSSSPSYAALTQPVPLSQTDIQKLVLDEETMLLEYALGKERSFLWAVSRDSIMTFELPKRSDIESKARRVHELFVTKADALYPEALQNLSRTILGPVANQLRRKRLLIVADGALQYVPFGALPLPSPNSGSSRTGKAQTRSKYYPLILEHEIISLPSASVVAVLRKVIQRDSVRSPHRLLVFADPVFTPDDERVMSGIKSQHVQGQDGNNRPTSLPSDMERSAGDLNITSFVRLPASRKEAEQITNFLPKGEFLKALDFAASRQFASSPEVMKYQIVHFATHSLLNNEHPELSGIVLSLVNEHGELQDGFLRLYEIYNLNLTADLVVLSSCQTALGKEIKGEGLVGLTRGFMYAGAPRVVASLWKVSDAATAELMKQLYENMLVRQMRPAEALRVAQLSLLKQKQWTAPYYWGGFVFQGEWR